MVRISRVMEGATISLVKRVGKSKFWKCDKCNKHYKAGGQVIAKDGFKK